MKHINRDTYDFILTTFSHVHLFYILPKIYEGTSPLHGLPIVNGCEGLFKHLAKYLDHFLQFFVQNMPSLIRDAKHYIQIIETKALTSEPILVILDVNTLYTSISHEDIRLTLHEILTPMKIYPHLLTFSWKY